MNQINNNNQINKYQMLKLTTKEITKIKELIYNKIDQEYGIENLDETLKELLTKLQSIK